MKCTNQIQEVSLKNLSPEDQYILLNQKIDHNIKNVARSAMTPEERVINKAANKILDKYYTKTSVARDCYLTLKEVLLESNVSLSKTLLIEPSAGAGAFLSECDDTKIIGFDVAPTASEFNIRKSDFIKEDLKSLLSAKEKRHNLVFIGNPPFGKNSKLGIEFIHKAFEYSDVVAYIVPLTMRSWVAQKQVNPNNKTARLIVDIDISRDSFEFMGQDASVGCCFQIWVSENFKTNREDLRLKSKPVNAHPEFTMTLWNKAKKEANPEFFESQEFDFFVQNSGFRADFSTLRTLKEEFDPDKSYMFFKAKDYDTSVKLMELDYVGLSTKNKVAAPGFSKHTVVTAFTNIHGIPEIVEEAVAVKVKKPRKAKTVMEEAIAVKVKKPKKVKAIADETIIAEEVAVETVSKEIIVLSDNDFASVSKRSLMLASSLYDIDLSVSDVSVNNKTTESFAGMVSGFGFESLQNAKAVNNVNSRGIDDDSFCVSVEHKEVELARAKRIKTGSRAFEFSERVLLCALPVVASNGYGGRIKSVNDAVYVKQFKSTA